MMAGWRTVPLGSLCDILDNKRKPITKKDRKPGEYPYYGATGIQDFVEGFLFDEPLVLVGEDGAKWASGENTAFAIDGKCWVNNHAHVLRPNRALLTDNWLIYYLVHSDLSPFVTGLTVPKLNQGSLREIPVPFPPLPEQQRIVAILDEAFDGIATAKANAEKNLQNARALFESHLQSVFTERREGWADVRLGDICDRVSVGHVGPTSEFYCDEGMGIRFLRSQNVRRGYLDWSGVQYVTPEFHRQLKKSQLQVGDLLFVRVGANRGDCCSVPDGAGELNCANIVFARPTRGNACYLERYCQSPQGRAQLLGMTTGSAQGVINTSSVAELILPLPPEKDQMKIVGKLTELQDETQRLESLYRKKLTALDDLKKSLLHQAFSGAL